MKTIKRILLILILTAVGMVPVSAHMFSGNNWTWLYSDSEVSVYLGRYYYDVDRDQLSCYLGYRYPAQNSCRVEFTTFDYYYKKYIVIYREEYDDRGHELDSYNTNAGWEDVEANDGTFMGMLMQKAADNSSRDYQLLYYDPRTHPHKSHK